MLNNRHFIAYSITTLFYLALAGIITYLPTATKIATETSQEKVIQISVTEFVPEPPVEEVEPEKEEIKEEETTEEEKKEKPLEEIAEVLVPEPVVEKPKPEVIKKEIKKKVVKKKPIKQKTKKQKTSKKPVKKKVKRQSSSQKRKVNPAKVNLFYKQIRVKINKYKAYPKIAKRRRMQGTVKVTFTILASGRVSNIKLSGPKIFHKSAKKAVQRAFPVNVKNIPISLPSTVHVNLHYSIR